MAGAAAPVWDLEGGFFMRFSIRQRAKIVQLLN